MSLPPARRNAKPGAGPEVGVWIIRHPAQLRPRARNTSRSTLWISSFATFTASRLAGSWRVHAGEGLLQRLDSNFEAPRLGSCIHSEIHLGRLCEENFAETAALRYMIPWLLDEVERTRSVMGDDFWPYGLDANPENLRTFLRYSHDQGLAARAVEPEELSHPETLESALV